MIAADGKDVDPSVWTPAHVAVIRAAAEDPQVERIFVNAAIKKALCRDAGSTRAWLYRAQPRWNHTYHFHVRCPADDADCHGQPEVSSGEGCGKELDRWFTDAVLHPKAQWPGPPKQPITMTDLPRRQVLRAPLEWRAANPREPAGC